MAQAILTCSCGSLKAEVTELYPHDGVHAICHCEDCRASARALAPGTQLPDGADIYQTYPDTLGILEGHENLACLTLSPRGLLRWYASCCNTPMFNTPRSSKVSFVGILADNAADKSVFGPVRAHGFIKTKDGKTRHKGLATLVFRSLKRILIARLSGRWQTNPLFDTIANKPVAEPRLLSKKDKAAAYAP